MTYFRNPQGGPCVTEVCIFKHTNVNVDKMIFKDLICFSIKILAVKIFVIRINFVIYHLISIWIILSKLKRLLGTFFMLTVSNLQAFLEN